ncbi:MAG: hypothetical protein ACFE8L_09375 [Candidatus Hodarchaeota archaeon]
MGLGNSMIRVCPVCGFSFKPYDPKTKKKLIACPMCGHKIVDPSVFPDKQDEFDKKFI